MVNKKMKTGVIRSVTCLVFLILLTNHVWAEDWISFAASDQGDMYYDKTSIRKSNQNVGYVCTKTTYSENEKKKIFAMLNSFQKAPNYPDMLSHAVVLLEIDCDNETIKDFCTMIYDIKGALIFFSVNGNAGEKKRIAPHSYAQKLKNIVCKETTAQSVVATESIEAAPSAADKHPVQPAGDKSEPTDTSDTAIRNFISGWIASWQSGVMNTYRSCYTPDFKSKGKNLDEWISYKTAIHRKSKDISIRIDQLQISVKDNHATAEFIQQYSSSIYKDSGKKKLELRKINGEWKIYREIM